MDNGRKFNLYSPPLMRKAPPSWAFLHLLTCAFFMILSFCVNREGLALRYRFGDFRILFYFSIFHLWLDTRGLAFI